MPTDATRSTFRILISIAAGLLGAAVLSIGLTIWWLRSDAISDASRDTGNLAVVLADQIANSIQSIDLVLTEIRDQEEIHGAQASNDFDRALGGEDTFKFLMERLSRLLQAEFIGLVDKNGRLVNTTQQWPSPGIDVSKTAHFPHFKNNNDKGIYITNSQVERRWRPARLS
jgi:hypothetical protein